MAVTGSPISDPVRVEALIFDVDDTLYEQRTWLAGAWVDVAAAAAQTHGIDEAAFLHALQQVAARGSDQGGIIDQALVQCGADIPAKPLVEVFLAHRPERLPLLPGVAAMLAELREGGVPVALVTDGALSTQESKLAALGLDYLAGTSVLSDRFGRQFRKPHPRPVLEALALLGSAPEVTVMIGDRPTKDVAAAAGAGVRAVRVRTGEYAGAPNHPFTWREAPDAPTAVAQLRASGLLRLGS
jgi:putative hydrolase of the HAD superfamily